MVKRFQDDISMGGDWTNSTSFMAEKPDGEYVLFSDYEKLVEQENARERFNEHCWCSLVVITTRLRKRQRPGTHERSIHDPFKL